MLLAPEHSAPTIHEDYLLIGGGAFRIPDSAILGISFRESADSSNDAAQRVLEVRFDDPREGIRVVSLGADDGLGEEQLNSYAERVAKHAIRNVLQTVAEGEALEINSVKFGQSGLTFVASGEPIVAEYTDVTAVEVVADHTLLWREAELEPFAILRESDPCALMLRELFVRSVSSSTQQTDWIAADQDFFQMVGPIECQQRSLVPSYGTLRVVAIAFSGLLAAIAWMTVPQYAIYVSGLIACLLMIGMVLLTKQADASGTILAVFRRGVTLIGSGGEDVVVSWLDITDATLHRQPRPRTVDGEASESVSLELQTSAEVGQTIKLEWESRPSNHIALAYLEKELQRRVWKHADR